MMETLAWTLIHFLWEGTLIALALWVFRPASARVRYAAASFAMLAMLAAFALTLARLQPRVGRALRPLPTLPWSRLQPATGASAPVPVNSPDPFYWLAPLWMSGVALLSLRSIASWLAAQRLRRVGVCSAPEHWQQKLRELAARIRLPRPVWLLESCLTDVPVVVGWLRPAILVPAGLLTGFPPAQVECFLLHELAHIRRWDYLVNLLQCVAEDLLFYHPAVWWVSGLIRSERENCCDDVVAELGDAHGFAAALAALEHHRSAVRQPALAVTGGRLVNRIRRLLGQPESRPSILVPVLLAGALVASLAIAIAAPPQLVAPAAPVPKAAPPLRAQAQPNAPPNARPAEPSILDEPWARPYRNWLDEEVVYIISDAERIAFRNLRAEAELQYFIEQFWLRRDPTPDTPENEYREEHYRRIAYVNDRFRSSTVPGWKTDRGAIYIRFGPPDELESHPAAPNTPARERWRYRYIQGIGIDVILEFNDPIGTGEFHMTRDPSAQSAPAPKPQAAAAPAAVPRPPEAAGVPAPVIIATAVDLPMVTVTRTGQLYLNSQPVKNLGLLASDIRRKFKTNSVYVQGDRRAPYDAVMQVVDVLGKERFDMKLVAKPEDVPAAGVQGRQAVPPQSPLP